MPIQVYIEVNGKPIESIHISRETRAKRTDVNIYTAVRKEATPATDYKSRAHAEMPSYREWEDDGVRFEHTYGDGVEILVQKAIEALNVSGR